MVWIPGGDHVHDSQLRFSNFSAVATEMQPLRQATEQNQPEGKSDGAAVGASQKQQKKEKEKENTLLLAPQSANRGEQSDEGRETHSRDKPWNVKHPKQKDQLQKEPGSLTAMCNWVTLLTRWQKFCADVCAKMRRH